MVLRNRPNHQDDNLLVVTIERDLAKALEGELAKVDYRAADCLVLGLDILDKAGIERQRIATHLGVSTTTVSRWASNEIVPRAIAFRKAMLAGMLELVSEVHHTREEQVRKLEALRPKDRSRSPTTPALTP